jgi:hypothetical protein
LLLRQLERLNQELDFLRSLLKIKTLLEIHPHHLFLPGSNDSHDGIHLEDIHVGALNFKYGQLLFLS